MSHCEVVDENGNSGLSGVKLGNNCYTWKDFVEGMSVRKTEVDLGDQDKQPLFHDKKSVVSKSKVTLKPVHLCHPDLVQISHAVHEVFISRALVQRVWVCKPKKMWLWNQCLKLFIELLEEVWGIHLLFDMIGTQLKLLVPKFKPNHGYLVPMMSNVSLNLPKEHVIIIYIFLCKLTKTF